MQPLMESDTTIQLTTVMYSHYRVQKQCSQNSSASSDRFPLHCNNEIYITWNELFSSTFKQLFSVYINGVKLLKILLKLWIEWRMLAKRTVGKNSTNMSSEITGNQNYMWWTKAMDPRALTSDVHKIGQLGQS